MTKQIMKKGIYALLLAIAVASPLGARTVSADELTSTDQTTVTTTAAESTRKNAQEAAKAKAEAAREAAKKKAEAAREAAKVKADAKLAENKQRICEQKQTRLQGRLDKIAAQGTRQLAVFEKISTKVQEFKTTKNLTVTNYASLVEKVDAAHVDAVKAVADATKAPTFDCADPVAAKTTVEAYKKAIVARNKALKTYKTAVKDLLVAVKSSQRQNDTDKMTTITNTTTNTSAGGTN